MNKIICIDGCIVYLGRTCPFCRQDGTWCDYYNKSIPKDVIDRPNWCGVIYITAKEKND